MNQDLFLVDKLLKKKLAKEYHILGEMSIVV
jgi:hypothetical protein